MAAAAEQVTAELDILRGGMEGSLCLHISKGPRACLCAEQEVVAGPRGAKHHKAILLSHVSYQVCSWLFVLGVL